MPKSRKIMPYPKDECGIIGIYNVEEAANYTYLGLHALQHRGQESTGIVSTNENHFLRFAGMGKVTDVFTESKLKQLQWKICHWSQPLQYHGGQLFKKCPAHKI